MAPSQRCKQWPCCSAQSATRLAGWLLLSRQQILWSATAELAGWLAYIGPPLLPPQLAVLSWLGLGASPKQLGCFRLFVLSTEVRIIAQQPASTEPRRIQSDFLIHLTLLRIALFFLILTSRQSLSGLFLGRAYRRWWWLAHWTWYLPTVGGQTKFRP